MDQSEFQDNTKTLMVPTSNIFDQNHCRIIIRTSLRNSRNSFREMFLQSKIKYQRLYSSWIKVNFNRIVKHSLFLLTTFLMKNTLES